jgi:hypothetical protein
MTKAYVGNFLFLDFCELKLAVLTEVIIETPFCACLAMEL